VVDKSPQWRKESRKKKQTDRPPPPTGQQQSISDELAQEAAAAHECNVIKAEAEGRRSSSSASLCCY
jgi:hypothetical protein